MSLSCRHILVLTTIAGSFSLLALQPSASARAVPAPVPPRNTIAVPSSAQISSTMDTTRCPWMNGYLAALTGGLAGVANADKNPLAWKTASGYALLIAAPLVATRCGMAEG